MNILHFIDHALPYRDGYAARTHYVLRFQREMGYCPMGVTLPGVQSRLLGKRGLSPQAVDWIDGIQYRHFLDTEQTIVSLAKKLFSLHFFERLKTKASTIYHVPSSQRTSFFAPLVASHRRKALSQYYLPIARSLGPFDLLHAHWPPLNAHYALMAAHQLGLPIVYEIRCLFEDTLVAVGETIANSPIYQQRRQADTNAAQSVDGVITISEQLKRDFANRGIPEQNIYVVPNGVDTRTFTPMPRDEELAEQFQLNGKMVIGFIGSLKKYEGLGLLLHAIRHIRDTVPEVKGLIVGGGPELAALKAEASRLGISSLIHFTGEVPLAEVHHYYSLIDVFVIPRLDQRVNQLVTPLKPYEAMAMEKALLVSNVGGLTEIIEEGQTGVSFKAEDVNALVQQAKLLLRDDLLRRRLGRQAREWVVRERDWQEVVGRYRSVYACVLEKHARTRPSSSSPDHLAAVEAKSANMET
jgi:glycosyltransferase involved in cell wall biosynthesis